MAVTDQRAAPYEISAGGPLKPELLEQVIELRIEQLVSVADRAIVRFADPDLEITDGDTFEVGKPFQVKLGSPHASSPPAEVFSGEVVTIEADMGVTGKHLIVIALDRSHRLRRETRTKSFNNVNAGDIARTLASQHGLTVGTIDSSDPPRDVVFQDGESDWQLLARLSDEVGCDLDVDEGKLQLVKRKASGTAVELTLGETLRSFRPRLSGVAQVDTVEVRSWNPKTKQPISETAQLAPPVSAQASTRNKAASALGGGAIVIVDHPAASTGVAKAAATAVADGLGATMLEATAVAIGDPRIRAGGVVKLSGVGKRFGGEHRVVAATHILRGGSGYETRITLGAGGRPLVDEFAGRGRSRGFAAHLAIGLVTNNSDPNKLGRVKIKYPVLDDKSETTWVRVASPAAGSSRGMIVIPQIGDEVVIGFEHGDIDRPVVLGALYNGTDKPKLASESATPQSLGVTLPGDVVTTIDGNVKTTAKQGITMSSMGAITVEGKGAQAVKITSQGELQMTSQLPAQLKGLETTVEGEAMTTLKSSGAVQIQASGPVTISGAAITVNSEGPLALKGSPVVLG